MADNQPKYNTKRVLKRYKIIGFVFGFVGLLILIKAGYLMRAIIGWPWAKSSKVRIDRCRPRVAIYFRPTVNFWPPHCRNIASTSTPCRGNPIPHAA